VSEATEPSELPGLRGRAATIRRLERGSGSLSSAALARMDETLPWFKTMPAETRAWIGLVAQAGVASFVEWYRRHPDSTVEIRGEVFGAAPRELARLVTLRQTVDMVRVTVEVMENRVHEFAAPGAEADLQDAVVRFSREVAFSAAQVYAAAAEQRGAWDARLESLVVDALVRDEVDDALSSRAAALGWASPAVVAVLAGRPPQAEPQVVVTGIHRAARKAGLDVLAGVQGERLVVVVGGTGTAESMATGLLGEFGAGCVVLGPAVPDLLAAGRSARAALAGQRAAAAWPGAPQLVLAIDLLPERAIDGDQDARDYLVEHVFRPVVAAGGDLLETVATYLEQGGSLEATARALFVHANTVRYRLRRLAELTGYAAGTPRDAFALQVALALGRLDDERTSPPRL
jgi:PucR C-terminal helix-turn-helix domain/GGDEF-like domain